MNVKTNETAVVFVPPEAYKSGKRVLRSALHHLGEKGAPEDGSSDVLTIERRRGIRRAMLGKWTTRNLVVPPDAVWNHGKDLMSEHEHAPQFPVWIDSKTRQALYAAEGSGAIPVPFGEALELVR